MFTYPARYDTREGRIEMMVTTSIGGRLGVAISLLSGCDFNRRLLDETLVMFVVDEDV